MGKWVAGVSFIVFVAIFFSNVDMGFSGDATTSSTPAMYVLGDSSVDCGDNTPLYYLLHSNLSLFPCNGSDQTLLPQLIAKKVRLPNTIPFYSQNGSIQSILGGVNFGSAEATILYPSTRGYQSLNQQLRQAFETIQLLQLQLGEKTANDFLQSSIFYLSFGKDDFILRSPADVNTHLGRNLSRILAHQMTNAVRDLYDNNARKIVCSGVVPLGCAPRFMTTSGDGDCCSDEVNMAVLEYNTMMEENIVVMNEELAGAHVVFCDVYRGMMEIINNPTAYGIGDVKNACCGAGKYGGESGCLSTEMACEEASTHVWWDIYNPTPAVNELLADSASTGQPLTSICRPITVQELLSLTS